MIFLKKIMLLTLILCCVTMFAAEYKLDTSKFVVGQDPISQSQNVLGGRLAVECQEIDGEIAIVMPAKTSTKAQKFVGFDILLRNLLSINSLKYNQETPFKLSFKYKAVEKADNSANSPTYGVNLYNFIRMYINANGQIDILANKGKTTASDENGAAFNLDKWLNFDIIYYPSEKKIALIINNIVQCNGKFDLFNADKLEPMLRINPTIDANDNKYFPIAIKDVTLTLEPTDDITKLKKAMVATKSSGGSSSPAMQVSKDISGLKVESLKDVKSGAELLILNKIAAQQKNAPARSWAGIGSGATGEFLFSPAADGSTICKMSSGKDISRLQYGIPAIADIDKFGGQIMTFTATVSGKNIAEGEGPVAVLNFEGKGGDGYNINLAPKYKDADKKKVDPTLGSFDDIVMTATVRIPEQTKMIKALIYLMNSTGELEWKNISMKYTPELKSVNHAMPISFLSPEAARKNAIVKGNQFVEARKKQLLAQFGKLVKGSDFYDSTAKLEKPHPRLLPLGITLDEIRKRAKNPAYKHIVDAIKVQADAFCNYTQGQPNMESEDPMRGLGDVPQWLLMAYIMEDNPAEKAKYQKHLYRWMNSLIDWGLCKQDLPSAHSQLSFILTYDWLYDELPADLKAKIRQRIIDVMRYSNSNEWYGFYMWRYCQFLANHNWFVHKIMGLSAIALWTDTGDDLKKDELQFMLDEMIANLYYIENVHSADGYPVEGVLYQDYGLRPYFDVATLVTPLLDLKFDLLGNSSIKQTAESRLSLLLPGTTGFMVYSDAKAKQYAGSTYWYALASIHNDPKAQYLAKLCEERAGSYGALTANLGPQNLKSNAWREMFFYNPDIKVATANDLPLYGNGKELGLYVARSSWSDQNAAFVGIRCGDPVGQSARKFMGQTLSNGHCYPEQGNFSFYIGNDDIIPGMDYARIKLTSNHNLTIFEDTRKDDQFIGQAGEGGAWFDTGEVKIFNFPKNAPSPKVYGLENTADYSIYKTDIGCYYFLADNNKKLTVNPDYKRIIVFLPEEKNLVVVDKIATKSAVDTKFRMLTGAISGTKNGRNYTVKMKNGNEYVLKDFSPVEYEGKVKFEKLLNWGKTDRQTVELFAKDFTSGIFAMGIGSPDSIANLDVVANDKTVIIKRKGKKDLTVSWE